MSAKLATTVGLSVEVARTWNELRRRRTAAPAPMRGPCALVVAANASSVAASGGTTVHASGTFGKVVPALVGALDDKRQRESLSRDAGLAVPLDLAELVERAAAEDVGRDRLGARAG